MDSNSKILVAVDFSENSVRALDAAIAQASRFDASIELVHACNGQVPMIYLYEIPTPDALMRDARNAARAMLKADQEKVQSANIEVKTHLTEAPAQTAITELAEKIAADLIVIGTRGRTSLEHVLMGSVAECTVRHAPCSV